MILVVGGTGFIGRNFLQALHRSGRKAMSVSRQPDRSFLAAHAPSVSALTVEELQADPAAALFNCSAVVYLASTSTPGANLGAPWREAQGTIDPLMRVLTYVVNHSAAHFIYLSSGGTVYGPTGAGLIGENTPLNPISPYGLGKKMSEAAVGFMAASGGLTYTILRPANPIGRWQESRSQGVVGALMRAARAGTAFPMIGDGSAVRDYFDVADLVTAVEATIAAPDKAAGQVWNVGSGQGHSVRQMLELVEQVSGRRIRIEERPDRASDVDRVVLDVSAIRDALGWQARTRLETSLQDIWTATSG